MPLNTLIQYCRVRFALIWIDMEPILSLSVIFIKARLSGLTRDGRGLFSFFREDTGVLRDNVISDYFLSELEQPLQVLEKCTLKSIN